MEKRVLLCAGLLCLLNGQVMGMGYVKGLFVSKAAKEEALLKELKQQFEDAKKIIAERKVKITEELLKQYVIGEKENITYELHNINPLTLGLYKELFNKTKSINDEIVKLKKNKKENKEFIKKNRMLLLGVMYKALVAYGLDSLSSQGFSALLKSYYRFDEKELYSKKDKLKKVDRVKEIVLSVVSKKTGNLEYKGPKYQSLGIYGLSSYSQYESCLLSSENYDLRKLSGENTKELIKQRLSDPKLIHAANKQKELEEKACKLYREKTAAYLDASSIQNLIASCIVIKNKQKQK